MLSDQTGATVGSDAQGVEELMARDRRRAWVDGTGDHRQHLQPAPTRVPRVVPIGVMDIDWYLSQDPTGSNGVLRMVNIYGFFIEGMGNVDPSTGRMTLQPGGHRSSAGS